MKSDRLIHYLGKYGFLLFSLLFFSDSIFFTVEGFQSKEWNVELILTSVIIATVFLIPFVYFKDKFAIIEFGNQYLKILRGKDVIEINWLDVESVKNVWFSNPVLYKLRIRDREGYFLFGSSQGAFRIGGLLIDNSDIGVLIEKKKRDLSI